MNTHVSDVRPRNGFDRLFGLEKHEYLAVAWSFIYFFCILSSYYMLRPVRETMSAENGALNVPYLFSSTFVVMLLAAPVFGWVSSRYPRKQFLPWVYAFFSANLLFFWAGFTYAIENDIDYLWLGRTFFIWLSIFNLFVVSVFWSFMADIYTREQGRRLFGLISAGGSTGALAGPFATRLLVSEIGFHNILLISAALLFFGVYCISRLRTWVIAEHGDDPDVSIASSRPLGGSAIDGIRQALKSRYLFSMVVVSIIASLLGTALYMFMADFVGSSDMTTNERVETFSLIDGTTNVLSLIGQLFLVNRSVRRFGVGMTLAILPVVSLLGLMLLAINPAFIVVAVLTAVRRGIGFGFSKPTHDMLYSVVTPSEKYKAKNFIETAVYRSGDLIGSWLIKFIWAIGISGISIVMLPFGVFWVLLALWLGRDYTRRDRLEPVADSAR
ncbi:MAG: MFS transporter [Gammaproteobacteria bacterium]|nr:MFS transporter [Gammaproteobacteria bacterium]MDH5303854.1 MFS transporter [Gammaproteobacteria bacterium]MDH5321457.1 MFS transporter [Gammaproteobacteria bacterium]